MSASVELRGVTLDYPVYAVRAQSLRSTVASIAVGGKFMRTSTDIAIVRSLANVSFKLAAGDRIALVGHNGSGKTSLLKVLAGVYEPTGGWIKIDGQVSSMISISVGLDMDASGLQNIRSLCAMKLVPKKQVEAELPAIVEFSGLGPFINMPFKTYSAGMMARLTFSVATAFPAEILIMDEWLSAGDADFMSKAVDRMQHMFDRANIVVLATHSFDLVERVCNKVMELDGGQIKFLGSTEEWLRWRAAAA